MPDDYEVGYRKPPNHTRFKPGHSGNPKGRPNGTKNLKTDLSEELQERIQVTEGGRQQAISKQRAMVKSLMAKAIKGDTKAANTILGLYDRLLSAREGDQDDVRLPKEDQAILDLYVARSGAMNDGGVTGAE